MNTVIETLKTIESACRFVRSTELNNSALNNKVNYNSDAIQTELYDVVDALIRVIELIERRDAVATKNALKR